MFDDKTNFDKFCKDNKLDLILSFDMPVGYETANGMFDIAKKTVFINKKMLSDFPEIEQCFCFFHELRHALQYLKPELFDDHIVNSLSYVIMYDGTCYKVVDGEYFECKLDGDSDYFLRLYKGQPYEVDANMFAFDKTKELFGLSEELKELCTFYLPDVALGEAEYEKIYRLIDKKINLMQ